MIRDEGDLFRGKDGVERINGIESIIATSRRFPLTIEQALDQNFEN